MIKIRNLDGRNRYYPASYLTPTIEVAKPKEVKEAPKETPKPQNLTAAIETLAKDYAWDAESETNLKGFIAWLKEQDNG